MPLMPSNELLTDPFQPSVTQTPAQAPGLGSQWSDALNDPQVKTALLQFGISMLQPPSFGDTFGSQVGRAIGSAGEALSEKAEEERKERESESRTVLREAQATSAETRARVAGAGLGVQQQRLGLQADKLELQRQQNEIKNEIAKGNLELAREKLSYMKGDMETRRLRAEVDAAFKSGNQALAMQKFNQLKLEQDRQFDLARDKFGLSGLLGQQKVDTSRINAYTKAKEAHDNARFLDPSLPPFPDYSDWISGFGATGTPTSRTPSNIPPANQRPPGIYQTPKGPLRWSGPPDNVWLPP